MERERRGRERERRGRERERRGRETRPIYGGNAGQGGHGAEEKTGKSAYGTGDATTFFFSNFSNGFGELDMHKIFQKWARVKEVFIARRLNKGGRRFGFVRFFEVGNAARLEKELDQIFIGNVKLHVNVPRYRRHVPESRVYKFPPVVPHPESRRRGGEGQAEVRRERKKAIWVKKKGEESYAEIVRGGPRQAWKGPTFSAQKQILPWMEASVVGQLRAELDLDQLREEFLKGGLSTVFLRSLGDNLVMLMPREGESMQALIKLNKEWFESVFTSFEPWSEKCIASHKVVWVRCYGLPLSLWNKECFSKVVGDKASLVSIGKATLLWENLEYAILQVRMPKSQSVRMAVDMKINNNLYNILLEEEVICGNRGSCRCNCDDVGSSDSVSSSETYVEETASVNSCEEEGKVRGRIRQWPRAEEIGGEANGEEVLIGREVVGDGEGLQKTTKGLVCGEATSKGLVSQRVSAKGFTNVETVHLIASDEAAILKTCNHGPTALHNSTNPRADVAKLVVDEELSCTQHESSVFLGHEVNRLEVGDGELLSKDDGSVGRSVVRPEGGVSVVRSFGRTNQPIHEGASVVRELEPKEVLEIRGHEVSKGGDGELLSKDDGSVGRSVVRPEGGVSFVRSSGRTNQHIHEGASVVRELEPREVLEIRGNEVSKGGSGIRNLSPRGSLRTKGLGEMAEPSTLPRRSIRVWPSQVRDSASKAGSFSATISDGDTICNSRFRDLDVTVEPLKLWEMGKQMGIVCRRIEEEVVKEYQSMEARDVEFSQKLEEGVTKGFLC